MSSPELASCEFLERWWRFIEGGATFAKLTVWQANVRLLGGVNWALRFLCDLVRETQEDIIRDAARGDMQALETLLQCHYVRLLQYASKNLPEKLRGSIGPDDIVQDTCFEACRLIRNFVPRGKDSVFRWLVTIARHRMIDLVRLHRQRGNQSCWRDDDDSIVKLLAELAIYHRTPSKSAASHEFLAALEESIGRLPTAYRQAITLRHLEGLSVSQTAARMDRSVESVYWLCCRAIQAIRADLRSASLFV